MVQGQHTHTEYKPILYIYLDTCTSLSHIQISLNWIHLFKNQLYRIPDWQDIKNYNKSDLPDMCTTNIFRQRNTHMHTMLPVFQLEINRLEWIWYKFWKCQRLVELMSPRQTEQYCVRVSAISSLYEEDDGPPFFFCSSSCSRSSRNCTCCVPTLWAVSVAVMSIWAYLVDPLPVAENYYHCHELYILPMRQLCSSTVQ